MNDDEFEVVYDTPSQAPAIPGAEDDDTQPDDYTFDDWALI